MVKAENADAIINLDQTLKQQKITLIPTLQPDKRINISNQ